MLIDKGYKLSKYGVDGILGKETGAAVKAFQKANGLKVDGILGPETIAALEKMQQVKQSSNKQIPTNTSANDSQSSNTITTTRYRDNSIKPSYKERYKQNSSYTAPIEQQMTVEQRAAQNPNATYLSPATERDWMQRLADKTERVRKPFEHGNDDLGNYTGIYGLMRTPDNIRDLVKNPT